MKRLIVLADGTWNKPDRHDRGKRKPSNIVKLLRGIYPQASDGTPQVVYYDEGVGTNWGFDKIIGGSAGRGLSKNVIQAYRFLVHNYVDGDHIFLIGFSRGAYTVRSLSGLIEQFGLLVKAHDFFVPDAYALYRRPNDEAVQAFRNAHPSVSVEITFLGVFDTVGALGIPLSIFQRFNRKMHAFHQVRMSSAVKNAFQALAIDERRLPFTPSLWEGPPPPGSRLEQMWFAGVHRNIGGGYEKDGLANIPLHWIKERAKEQGLDFDEQLLAHYKPWFGHELRNSSTLPYRLIGLRWRDIGVTRAGNESVHPTVLQRRRHDHTYRPKNLEAYLARGPVRQQSNAPSSV